tara:strand:- start:330 stop:1232 length:903 start_codon:yes stop_codon:yes gene_type:complete
MASAASSASQPSTPGLSGASSGELAFRVEGLQRRFRTGLLLRPKDALRGIDLDLTRGRTLGLVGPNGSGKTTLMRILAGVERATAGELEVLGGHPRERSVRARSAWLPSDAPFPAELNAHANLDLLGALSGMPRARVRERGANLLQQVGLTEHAHRPLRTYSSGMLRRFALAQAFLTDPDLVLLDEPTAGLDAQGFEVLEDLVQEARARGATLVIASHLLSDVHAHCEELAVLLDGRVALAGSPDELLGDANRREIVVEGLDDAALERLGAWAMQQGGRIVDHRPGGRTLLDLYRAGRAS